MKKITMFIAALSSGGAEHQLSILANFLSERGYDIDLVTYSDFEDHYELDERIKRIRLAIGKSKLLKIFEVLRFFIFHKTDIVISFGNRDNMLSLLPLLFRRKIKHLAGERCVNYKPLKWYQKLNYRLLYKRTDFIVTNSYTQAKDIKDRFPYLSRKVSTITNYTDLNLYNVVEVEQKQEVKIGIFCRYAMQKNYKRFAEVVRSLKSICDKKFKIEWFGNKGTKERPNVFYEEFVSLIKKYDIEDVLILHDHVKDVPSLLPHFDGLCLPSLAEGFSNSISEYICCGRPVVCSDVADNRYLVKDGENGFLFNPMDINDMVEKMHSFIMLSPNEMERMGQKSRAIAETLFDSKQFTDQYINLIER